MAYYTRYMNSIGNFQAVKRLGNVSEVTLQDIDKPTDGKIYNMFHGTTSDTAIKIIKNGFCQPRDGMLGKGVYVSRDLNKALLYPFEDKTDQVVLELRVNVGRVIKIDQPNLRLKKTWHDHGYDTAWVPPNCGMVKSELEEFCVWDPLRIKIVGIAFISPEHKRQCLLDVFEQTHAQAAKRRI